MPMIGLRRYAEMRGEAAHKTADKWRVSGREIVGEHWDGTQAPVATTHGKGWGRSAVPRLIASLYNDLPAWLRILEAVRHHFEVDAKQAGHDDRECPVCRLIGAEVRKSGLLLDD